MSDFKAGDIVVIREDYAPDHKKLREVVGEDLLVTTVKNDNSNGIIIARVSDPESIIRPDEYHYWNPSLFDLKIKRRDVEIMRYKL